MDAVVIYESIFGNTQAIAQAIARGLSPHIPVREVQLPSFFPARDILDAELVVLGGPTHTFGMSRPDSRREAARRHPDHGERAGGIREWLAALADEAVGRSVVVFDTRLSSFRYTPGSAAGEASEHLQEKGATLVDDPHSFYVDGDEGPLHAGELERAEEWGGRLGRAVVIAHQLPRTREDRRRWGT
ncbi:flavodoxin family protein [Oerskovia paurometabola]|uniref:flavodoxin family protein n=1 Tax=Oerskovia paurometabola TaxID=162170 RepID=UPI0037FD729E